MTSVCTGYARRTMITLAEQPLGKEGGREGSYKITGKSIWVIIFFFFFLHSQVFTASALPCMFHYRMNVF